MYEAVVKPFLKDFKDFKRPFLFCYLKRYVEIAKYCKPLFKDLPALDNF